MTITLKLTNNTRYRIHDIGPYFHIQIKQDTILPFIYKWKNIRQYPNITELDRTKGLIQVEYINDHFLTIADALDWVKANPSYNDYILKVVTQNSKIDAFMASQPIKVHD